MDGTGTTPSPSLTNKNEEASIIPTDNDVLNGRGHQGHPGNKFYMQVIDENAQEYFNTYDESIIDIVIQRIMGQKEEEGRSQPGRFIKQDKDLNWILLKPAAIRQKIIGNLMRSVTKSKVEGKAPSSSSNKPKGSTHQNKSTSEHSSSSTSKTITKEKKKRGRKPAKKSQTTSKTRDDDAKAAHDNTTVHGNTNNTNNKANPLNIDTKDTTDTEEEEESIKKKSDILSSVERRRRRCRERRISSSSSSNQELQSSTHQHESKSENSSSSTSKTITKEKKKRGRKPAKKSQTTSKTRDDDAKAAHDNTTVHDNTNNKATPLNTDTKDTDKEEEEEEGIKKKSDILISVERRRRRRRERRISSSSSSNQELQSSTHQNESTSENPSSSTRRTVMKEEKKGTKNPTAKMSQTTSETHGDDAKVAHDTTSTTVHHDTRNKAPLNTDAKNTEEEGIKKKPAVLKNMDAARTGIPNDDTPITVMCEDTKHQNLIKSTAVPPPEKHESTTQQTTNIRTTDQSEKRCDNDLVESTSTEGKTRRSGKNTMHKTDNSKQQQATDKDENDGDKITESLNNDKKDQVRNVRKRRKTSMSEAPIDNSKQQTTDNDNDGDMHLNGKRLRRSSRHEGQVSSSSNRELRSSTSRNESTSENPSYSERKTIVKEKKKGGKKPSKKSQTTTIPHGDDTKAAHDITPTTSGDNSATSAKRMGRPRKIQSQGGTKKTKKKHNRKQDDMKEPSFDVLQWIRNMTRDKQRKEIATGMRVKVKFLIENKHKWYGGVIVDVVYGGKRIHIQYDDGTSEETSFPDEDIIVDDEENGHHQVSADAFIPKQLHASERIIPQKDEDEEEKFTPSECQTLEAKKESKTNIPKQQTTDNSNDGEMNLSGSGRISTFSPSLTNKNEEASIIPTNNDVVNGRGQKYPGNKFYKQVIDEHAQQYFNTYDESIIDIVIQRVMDQEEEGRSQPGRFIKQDKDLNWILLKPAAIRQKIIGNLMRSKVVGTGSLLTNMNTSGSRSSRRHAEGQVSSETPSSSTSKAIVKEKKRRRRKPAKKSQTTTLPRDDTKAAHEDNKSQVRNVKKRRKSSISTTPKENSKQQTTDKGNGDDKASESMMTNDEKNQETKVKKRSNDPIRTTPLETGKLDHQENRNNVVNVATHEAQYDKLLPLPETLPFPNLPQSSDCEFSFDDSTRVLLAKFKPCPKTGKVTISESDKTSLLEVMERDDVTVISEGLIDDVDWSALEDLEFLQDLLYSHHICTYSRVDTEDVESSIKYVERDEPRSMKVEDYFAYLHKYDNDCNIPSEVLSLKNFNLRKYLPSLTDDLNNNFKFREIMPGEEKCMTSALNKEAQSFLGPYLHITPPGPSTKIASATTDSCHQCLTGYHEVIMLRRLADDREKHALHLLTNNQTSSWPDITAIEECRRMRYYPSVFILEPKQCLHINKGRLHVLRTTLSSSLPSQDCHSALRSELLSEEKVSSNEICMSITWNWLYYGWTQQGIKNEVEIMLDSAKLNDGANKGCLAVPEAALFQMAQSMVAKCNQTSVSRSIEHGYRTVLEGIYDMLKSTILDHIKFYDLALKKSKQQSERHCVFIQETPNAAENPYISTVNPFGNDFFCKICSKELSNIYMHCRGCELILMKDFNICFDCHIDKKYSITVPMASQMYSHGRGQSTLHHTGDMSNDIKWGNRVSGCRNCQPGTFYRCAVCGYCDGCSCRCHTNFTLTYRFMTIEDEKRLLESVETILSKKVISDTDNTQNSLITTVIR